MPRNVDHIVETHQLAFARRAAGLPIWDLYIDVFHADLTFEQIRDRVAGILRSSPWLADRGEFDPLVEVVDALAAAENEDDFDACWDEVYDYADLERVWIATH